MVVSMGSVEVWTPAPHNTGMGEADVEGNKKKTYTREV